MTQSARLSATPALAYAAFNAVLDGCISTYLLLLNAPSNVRVNTLVQCCNSLAEASNTPGLSIDLPCGVAGFRTDILRGLYENMRLSTPCRTTALLSCGIVAKVSQTHLVSADSGDIVRLNRLSRPSLPVTIHQRQPLLHFPTRA